MVLGGPEKGDRRLRDVAEPRDARGHDHAVDPHDQAEERRDRACREAHRVHQATAGEPEGDREVGGEHEHVEGELHEPARRRPWLELRLVTEPPLQPRRTQRQQQDGGDHEDVQHVEEGVRLHAA